MDSGQVYHVFCVTTGKAYVGQTWGDLAKRWVSHCYKSNCVKLARAIRKYGPDSFVLTPLTQAWTQEELDAAEHYWIGFFDCIQNGYNIRSGGSRGRLSLETREKLRLVNLGKKGTSETKSKMSASQTKRWREFQFTSDAIARITAGQSGRVHSREERLLLSRAHGGRSVVVSECMVFDSQAQAASMLGVSQGHISLALRGHRKTVGGFSFRYGD